MFTIIKVLRVGCCDRAWLPFLFDFLRASFHRVIEDDFSFVWNFFLHIILEVTGEFLHADNDLLLSWCNNRLFCRLNLACFWIVFVFYNHLHRTRCKVALLSGRDIHIRIVDVFNIYAHFFVHFKIICRWFLAHSDNMFLWFLLSDFFRFHFAIRFTILDILSVASSLRAFFTLLVNDNLANR